MFVQRIVGLQLGTVVFDGPPDGLTPEVLTEIYGEEDWSATIRPVEEGGDEAVADAAAPVHQAAEPDREHMAGIT